MVPMSVDETLAVRDLIEAYYVRDIELLTPKLNNNGKNSNKTAPQCLLGLSA
jgi:hypothetical protein